MITGKKSVRSPFDIDISEAGRGKLGSLKDIGVDRQTFLDKSFKFLFTRDPYWRIYSTYIDKLYSPNIVFWNTWGNSIVRRNKLNRSVYKCGSGVPFSAFVHYVVTHLHKSDIHFIPMTTMCRVCDVHYDFVGRLENVVSDIEQLSHFLNINSSFLHDKDYKLSSSVDAIKDSTSDSLHAWRSKVTACTSALDLGRLIWRRLQTRGVIQHDIRFPYDSESKMKSVTAEEFRSKCTEAARQSTDKVKLKRQKLAGFYQAYRTVSINDMERLAAIYQQDFHILGYERRPSELFDNRKTEDRDFDILDWKRDWDVL